MRLQRGLQGCGGAAPARSCPLHEPSVCQILFQPAEPAEFLSTSQSGQIERFTNALSTPSALLLSIVRAVSFNGQHDQISNEIDLREATCLEHEAWTWQVNESSRIRGKEALKNAETAEIFSRNQSSS